MNAVSKMISVPGATLYTESRGEGPLLILIPGGPADAGVFTRLADALADRYKVVSYDPRGNSRSQFVGEPEDLDMNVMSDDAAVVIAAYGTDAFVFGNSGGAQIGLALATRYPQLVRHLIAHEPPCVELLPEKEKLHVEMENVVGELRANGPMAGMMAFMKMSGAKPPARPPENAPPPSAAQVQAGERTRNNFAYFLGHALRAIGRYRPDLERLRRNKVKITVGAGRDSEAELAHRAAAALSEALPAPFLMFPGGHGGFIEAPAEFASILHHAFHA